MDQHAFALVFWSNQNPRWCLVRALLIALFILLIVFTCSATALQSLDIACDTILSGKAKVMLAGGFDDFVEEGSYEFANMKATSNSLTEFAAGREPNEFSRPTTSTRAGVCFFCSPHGVDLITFMTVYGEPRLWYPGCYEC